jgi:hypothetical protein
MKNLIRLAFSFSISVFFVQNCLAQDLLSTFKPKTKKEKLVIAKLKALPEIVQHYAAKGESNRDVIVNTPDADNREYSFQVGTDFTDRFSTNYYLYIDPKTYQVFYLDFLDESGGKSITLEQWRYWRNKPEFNENHKWVNGKIVVLKYKKHVPKKSSQS